MKTAARKAIDNLTDNFKDRVPQDMRDKLLSVALLVKNDFIADLGGWPEPYGDGGMEKISGKSYDGFWSRQDGGFEVSALYRSDTDSSYHISSAQSEYMQGHEKYCYECFASDNKEEFKAAGIDPEWYSYDDLPEDLQTAFNDYECEWYEPALLRFEVWIDPPEDDYSGGRDAPGMVFFRLSLGYRDAPYYRSKNDETLFQFKLKPEDVLKRDAGFFLKLIKRKYKGVK